MADRRAASTRAAILVYAIVVAKQILTWFVLYPMAGYNDITLNATQAVTLLLGVLFVLVYRLGRRRIGLGMRELGEGTAGIAVGYGVLFLVLTGMRATGVDADYFRESYSAYAFLNNWVLTGFAEELLFAGVLFTLVLRARSVERSFRAAWPVVLIVAALFSLWHLPGYIAIALRSGGLIPGLIVDLILPFFSWLFIGTIYLLSGNLWLAAFVHASTDYALLPAIVNRPAMGVVFMVANVAIAAWLAHHRRGDLGRRTPGVHQRDDRPSDAARHRRGDGLREHRRSAARGGRSRGAAGRLSRPSGVYRHIQNPLSKEEKAMKTKEAEDGTRIPALGLGTFGIGGGMTASTSSDREHVEALRKAFELGYSHIDTAEVYADGHCEEVVGKAIEGYPREQFFITTKVDPSHLHYDDVHEAFEGSLSRLGVDYVDLYLIHWPSSSIPLEDSFRALNELVKQGTVRHVGVSNFSVEQLEEARRHCDSAIVTNQVPYGLHDRSYDANGMLAYCQKNGVLLTAYSPIKKASLADPTVKEIAEEKEATPAQIALAWLLAQPQVITIPKAADPGHLAENWKALDIELSDEDMRRLSGLS